ncbi:hypothetical protein HaLaN_23703, partial [Haematococcus lacustris]
PCPAGVGRHPPPLPRPAASQRRPPTRPLHRPGSTQPGPRVPAAAAVGPGGGPLPTAAPPGRPPVPCSRHPGQAPDPPGGGAGPVLCSQGAGQATTRRGAAPVAGRVVAAGINAAAQAAGAGQGKLATGMAGSGARGTGMSAGFSGARPEVQGHTVSLLFWALAQLRYCPPALLTRQLLQHTQELLPDVAVDVAQLVASMSGRECCALAWALARLEVRPPAAWLLLFRARVRQLAAEEQLRGAAAQPPTSTAAAAAARKGCNWAGMRALLNSAGGVRIRTPQLITSYFLLVTMGGAPGGNGRVACQDALCHLSLPKSCQGLTVLLAWRRKRDPGRSQSAASHMGRATQFLQLGSLTADTPAAPRLWTCVLQRQHPSPNRHFLKGVGLRVAHDSYEQHPLRDTFTSIFTTLLPAHPQCMGRRRVVVLVQPPVTMLRRFDYQTNYVHICFPGFWPDPLPGLSLAALSSKHDHKQRN